MLEIIAAVVVLVVVGLVVVIAMQKADFRITRSATMATPPSKPFEQVNNLRNWEGWSPWAKLDPEMTQAYDGPEAGKGAKHSWSGNNKVGEGRMEILESQPNTLVRMKLEFLRPMKATNDVEFSFESQGEQTAVTWTMTGRNNFMGKAFALFMNMDKMVGGDFEKGLASMKSKVES